MINLKLTLSRLSKVYFKPTAFGLAALVLSACGVSEEDETDYDLYYNGTPNSIQSSHIDIATNQSFSINHNFLEKFDLYVGATPALKDPRSRNEDNHILISKNLSFSTFGCRVDSSYIEMTCSFTSSVDEDITVDITSLVKELPTNLYIYASINTAKGEIVTGYRLAFN